MKSYTSCCLRVIAMPPFLANISECQAESAATFELLGDYAAGDAIAGVAGGIGLHVIGFGVDDNRRAAVAEQRVAIGTLEGNVFVHEADLGPAFGVDRKILHVAGVVAFGIIESVFFVFGIEMWTR